MSPLSFLVYETEHPIPKQKNQNCNKTTTATNFTDQKSSLPQEFRIFAISWTDLYLFVLQGTSDCSGQALLKLKSLIQSTKLDLWLLELKFSKCERESFKTKPNNNNGLTLTKKINKQQSQFCANSSNTDSSSQSFTNVFFHD